ncbi:hypothetical protein [Streptomyces sp. MS2.AVA.5]|uniref:Uncharacterized protein n=1 Tax=Streptomyces achmelvichensis TaxID=3134111 RepID=A0ACC6PPJ1_9ACTN
MGQPVISAPFVRPYDSAAATARPTAPLPRPGRPGPAPTTSGDRGPVPRLDSPLDGTPGGVEGSGAGPATAPQTGPGSPGRPS